MNGKRIEEGKGMDSWNKKDTYGQWISSGGQAFEVETSHEDEAIDIIKNLYFTGKISREEFHSLNIPLNSTSEVENFLFNRGWLRGVIDGKGEYLVNGRKSQRPSTAQLKWMKNHGKETKRTVYWCPAGEGQIIGMKTIYSPHDIMESGKKHKNPRLGLCYELSGRYVSHHQGSILVHGRLTNPFGAGHKELDHAWVILPNEEVFDPVMDKIWPKGVYEGLFKTKVHKKYTHDEVIRITSHTGHWGPWEDSELKEGRETERGKSLPQTGYAHKHVEIFRAMLATESNLKDNDYVTRSKKFAIEHSDHMTSVNEELYHVMRYVVRAEHVFEAWNPGEYFYSGPAVKGTEVYNSKKFL